MSHPTSHYPCDAKGYILKKKIGSGTYGRVYKANVCAVSWHTFAATAESCNGVSSGTIENMKIAGYDHHPKRLLEVTFADAQKFAIAAQEQEREAEEVIKAINACKIETNEEVAIKILDEDCNDWDDVQNEIHVMHDMHHKNIVSVHAAFLKNGAMDQIWIVMPLQAVGSIKSLIKEIPAYRSGIKDVKLLAGILKQALTALAYLHEDCRVHRDLKAANILMSKEGVVKLGDFGVTAARLVNLRSFVGTASFMAPEVIQRRRYSMKADIWSFGVTALELAYGHAPYAYLEVRDCLRATMSRPPPSYKNYSKRHDPMPRSFHKFIAKCLHKNPDQRPTARQLLSSSFFKNACRQKYVAEKCIKYILEKRSKESKQEEKVAMVHHKYWMIPVDSFILPKQPVRKSPQRMSSKRKLVQKPNAKAQKRWKAFLAHIEKDE
eukprot:CAMPEP_0170177466 /NCGR_PEP_ID=MMETSP0040_2-20121228/10101_1 /TAXON_ID=641309 /ORGANISM="Lotharella oceanica, Strain CCMP622" /LENGTH=435 /DNA_ID=CAMNT_0010420105 /DNA_START=39 /DNA_END=1346 /DNA_ORIENTATION=-